METNTPAVPLELPEALTASAYRHRYGRSLMVLRQLRAELPATDELCRVLAVDTVAPGLWITARFLDGTTRGFRPDLIRQSHGHETQLS
jgi:hypothetical protein